MDMHYNIDEALGAARGKATLRGEEYQIVDLYAEDRLRMEIKYSNLEAKLGELAVRVDVTAARAADTAADLDAWKEPTAEAVGAAAAAKPPVKIPTHKEMKAAAEQAQATHKSTMAEFSKIMKEYQRLGVDLVLEEVPDEVAHALNEREMHALADLYKHYRLNKVPAEDMLGKDSSEDGSSQGTT